MLKMYYLRFLLTASSKQINTPALVHLYWMVSKRLRLNSLIAGKKPSALANETAARRLFTLSLRYTLLICTLTVPVVITNSAQSPCS